VLHKDKHWCVREEVAKFGSYLDILRDDEDVNVRRAARSKLEELEEDSK
jgi:hypothetical protein